MARKKEAEEQESHEELVAMQDYADNLTDTINTFCNTWRMALSPTEQDVEDFDVMRLRHALGLYRTPEGMDLFPKARRLLAERGFVFQSAFGSEIMFLVRRGHEICTDLADYEEVED